MYRILLLNGEYKGKSFELHEGENYIGRTNDNDIVFPSQSISKRHCCIAVDGNKIEIQDLNSSNGIFVNGVKNDHEYLKKGSKISIGEFIFEVRENNQFPSLRQDQKNAISAIGIGSNSVQPYGDSDLEKAPPPSSSAIEKIDWHFEKRVMPVFYQMNQKYDWKSLALGMFVVFILASVSISVFPLLKQNEQSIIEEAQKRARLLSVQIAEDNATFIARDEETKTRITPLAKSKSVKLAVLTDLTGRIIAPPEYFNQIIVSAKEAKLLQKSSEVFKANSNQRGFSAYLGENIVASIEPVKLLDPAVGRNTTVAFALVSMDISNELFSVSEIGINFFSILIVVLVAALIVIYPFYRLTVKRFEEMNKDVDKILKGEQKELSTKYKFEELSPLIEVLNSAFQRISFNNADGEGYSAASQSSVSDYLPFIRSMGKSVQGGIIVCNKNYEVVFMNEIAEEMTGISFFDTENKKIFESARDEAFSSFMKDVLSQLESINNIMDSFEFSGISYQFDGSTIGSGNSMGFVFVITKNNSGMMDEAI